MSNYRKGKERIKPNKLGSLYLRKDIDKEDATIYIGGQMEHRMHILEQTGKTLDVGHNMFDGSWFYDYPLSGDRKSYNTENFAKNLNACLDEAKLENVTLITESAGGLIGAYASKSPRIQKVIAIHPPILGTPLADCRLLENHLLSYTTTEKIMIHIIKYLVSRDYGFEKDNLGGLILSKADLDKLVVLSSKLNRATEKNQLMVNLYDLIIKTTGLKTDGVVVYDPKKLTELGIRYLENEVELNHLNANSYEYLRDVYRRRRVIK